MNTSGSFGINAAGALMCQFSRYSGCLTLLEPCNGIAASHQITVTKEATEKLKI
jgi:hypothetical protein